MAKEWIPLIAYLGFNMHSITVCCFLQHFEHHRYSFLRLASISSRLFTLVSHSNLFPQLQRLQDCIYTFLHFPPLSFYHHHFFLGTAHFSLTFNVQLYFTGHCPCFLYHILMTHLHNPSCCMKALHHASEKQHTHTTIINSFHARSTSENALSPSKELSWKK